MITDVIIVIDHQIKTQIISFQIFTFMRLQNDNCVLKIKNIYNVKQIIRRKIFDALNSIQHFLNVLKKDN